jgi:hypothetical protein
MKGDRLMKRSLVGFAIATLLATLAVARCSTPSPTVTGVVITGTTAFVHKNATSQLTATANQSSGAPVDVTGTATWTTSDASVAVVTSSGLVTSQGNGSATITAAYQGKTGTTTVAIVLKAAPVATANFTRLCGPFRARMDVTITETSGDIGFTLTALTVIFTDFFHVQQVTKSFTLAELNALLGTTHFNASQSKVIPWEQGYTGGVDTEDSTGGLIATFTDDLGNTSFSNQSSITQHDGC